MRPSLSACRRRSDTAVAVTGKECTLSGKRDVLTSGQPWSATRSGHRQAASTCFKDAKQATSHFRFEAVEASCGATKEMKRTRCC
jgi:hypothetical protein